ncbi:MAG: hypothetical protein ACPGVZ_09290 [Myxococcota bacterium]
MHIKRFEAATLAEALAEVKSVLGPDALILSSRTIRRSRDRFGLLSRSVVEVQAARERDANPGVAAPVEEDRVVEPEEPRQRDVADAARDRFELEVRSELRSLHRAIEALSARSEAPARATDSGSVEDLAQHRLERAGLSASTGARLVAGWRAACEAQPGMGLEAFVRDAIDAKLQPPRPLEPGAVRLLVGAPGVGKTTTLAKLAARNEEGERDVALVSLDHDRVGASDPLRRYAALLESPFVEVSGADEIAALPARRAGHEVLVDTAGRGRLDQDPRVRLEPLRERLGEALRVELVVDATARADVLRRQIDRFAALRPDRIVFTRTDECEGVSPFVDLLLDPRCPSASWLGTGQRVPEDLLAAESGPLSRALFGAAA